MSNLTKRIISSFILITIVLCSIFLYNGLAFYLLVITVALLSLKEFYAISRQGEKSRNPSEIFGYAGIVLHFMIIIFADASTRSGNILCLYSAIVIGALSAEFFYKVHAPLRNTGATILGVLYIGLLGFLLLIGKTSGQTILFGVHFQNGGLRLLQLFCCVWSVDIGAYLIGKKFGRTKLCEGLSPKKTWEGSTGGFIISTFVSILLGTWFKFDLAQSMAIGGAIGVMSQLGDLAESAIKREFGVKDSGNIIPGHGGMLDRLDSLIFAAPVFYGLLLILR